ncbi:MAG: single-stranded-DNA-specific exonuclease RecJ [Treponema sp.]|nr:single-stranded-DNA-specific exonuclease RecJ [Treponema sp.]MDY5123683.1 single-stranded-DNA-specific exonuclease RecJ [Treponema sp.]
MTTWSKQPLTLQQIDPLCKKYEMESILASIFVRRGITEGEDILYYLESDLRFQHEPYNFTAMEDAVERILQAKTEGEKVLVFGDSDVDGITSTVILYNYLKKIGIDVEYRVPQEDDAYGLSIKAVDDFASKGGTLIITVDCGISNNEEIAHANDLCIDVIITDHHNPPENLPEAIIILDPKTEDSGYPYKDISGAAVAYKLVSALRFAHTAFYGMEICIFEIKENSEEKNYEINCVKVRNLVKEKELHEKIIPGKTSIYDLKFPSFVQGQAIYVWDAPFVKSELKNVFGSGVEFNLNDLKAEICKMIPSLNNKSSSDLQSLSVIAKYIEKENSSLNSLYNLYVTYVKRIISINFKKDIEDERYDMQLVGLAALADIMPMKNENRIFVKNAIQSMKKDLPRKGLAELFTRLKINTESLNSTELSWSVNPAINATGRLGVPDLALNLFLSESPQEREIYAEKILDTYEERKNIVQNSVYELHNKAEESVNKFQNKLCLVTDENLHKGLTGLFAAKMMGEFNIPAIAVTLDEKVCVGSMRSCRGIIATTFLDNLGDIFINHGGHNYAAGFSFERKNLDLFLKRIEEKYENINLEDAETEIKIDAEIPEQYLTPKLFNLLDIFEPYGAENGELVFFSRQLKLCDAQLVGKKEPQHLKLTFDCGKYKFPAMFWGQGDRLRKDINIGEKYDILYSLSKNYFNGIQTNQLLIKELYTTGN